MTRPALALLATAALSLAACGEDGVPPTLDVTVPSAISVQAGGSADLPVTLDRHGRASAVILSLQDLPAGVTAEAVSTDQAAATLHLVAGAGAVPGTHVVSLLAFESDELFSLIPLALTVTAAPPP